MIISEGIIMHQDIERIMISEEELRAKVKELGAILAEE